MWLAWNNIKRSRRSFLMASVGLIVGVASGTFFVALGLGVQDGVLNKIYPVNQIEIEPRQVAVMGFQRQVLSNSLLDASMVTDLQAIAGVSRVYPKLRAKVRARIWGGEGIFGGGVRGEAFFDGLAPELLLGELKEREEEAKPPAQRVRRAVSCAQEEECQFGEECRDGTCASIRYWKRFESQPMNLLCQRDRQCAPGKRCLEGRCAKACVDRAGCEQGQICEPDPFCTAETCPMSCRVGCGRDSDCPAGSACDPSAHACTPLRCRLQQAADQNKSLPRFWKGSLEGRCVGGLAANDPQCEALPCPGRTYCATESTTSAQGFCERPIPVVMSPFLVEIFNSTAVESLGVSRIEGAQALLGSRIRLKFGASIFGNVKDAKHISKRAEIVGFSDKALDLGVTMPIDYVNTINSFYAGPESANLYSTFILESSENQDVSHVIAAANARGFDLSRKSQDARKAADMLFILTLIFGFISLVIAAVAALNIGNTFLMIIHQRRYEIGIMRATGASRGDIARLILLEASFMGIAGGIAGVLVSLGASRLANSVAADQLQLALFKPENFFIYEWWNIAGGIGIAWVFCMVGASIPARRAAYLDPAVVLTS